MSPISSAVLCMDIWGAAIVIPARSAASAPQGKVPGTRLAFYLAETGMRLSLRFVLPLFLALGAFAYAAVPLVDRLTLQWFMRDLDIRASLIASAVQEPLQDLIQGGSGPRLPRGRKPISHGEQPLVVGFCPSAPGQ